MTMTPVKAPSPRGDSGVTDRPVETRRRKDGSTTFRRLAVGLGLAMVVAAAVLLAPAASFPTELRLPLGRQIEALIEWSYDGFAGLYDAIGQTLASSFDVLFAALMSLPAPTLAASMILVVLLRAGLALAGVATAVLVLTIALGLWEEMLQTLSLMTVAVVIAAAMGIALGIVASQVPYAQPAVRVLLDAMQTFPVFAYLVPAVFIFGPGNGAALVVTIIWALPPISRMTIVGLSSIPAETREATEAAGATAWQRLFRVDLPLSRPSIRAGLNQTIMYAMAMAVIAAMIGAAGLGQPVWGSLTRLEFGRALEAGIVLVLLAVVLDRASAAEKPRTKRARPAIGSVSIATWVRDALKGVSNQAKGAAGVFVAWAIVVAAVPALFVADFEQPPAWLSFSLRRPVDDFIDWINLNLGFVIDPTVAWLQRFVIDPGFELVARTPWWAVMVAVAAIASVYIGARTAGVVLVCLLGIASLGMWEPAGLTLVTAGVSVVMAVALAMPLGMAMSQSDVLNRLMRPALDVLQTTPIFLFVIPAVVILGTGSVAGVLATVLYAIAPMVRLTNVAIRGVDPVPVESATSSGATAWQLLRQVKVPLGLPTIMVGVNQTIMLCLAMAVVSAFIGTPGLGQEILIAVQTGQLGLGIDAGVAMFLLAFAVDRLATGATNSVTTRTHLERA